MRVSGDLMTALVKAIEEAKRLAKSRNFKQTVDLFITLRYVDMTKPENRINLEVELPRGRGKHVSVAVIADGDMALKAREVADLVITRDRLQELAKKKREAKKIARKYYWFVAQADLMPLVGRLLGPILGPRGKMPKPVPPTVDPRPIIEKLRRTVRIRTRNQPIVYVPIGTEDMSSEEIAENAMAVIEAVAAKLERGYDNIDKIYVKLTMGPTVEVS